MTAPVWSVSCPGVVTAGCGDVEDAFEVHHETGRMMRIGSEASLCFECGADGGVYHPDPDGPAGAGPLTMAELREIAAAFDRRFNLFRGHSHHTFVDGRDGPTIEHSHTDGADAHRHPDAATAWFGHRGEGVGKPSKAPSGERRPYVELTEAEATFRVVLQYRYINPGSQGSRVHVGRRLTAAERKALKPPPEWSRAEWRRSLEVTVHAIRLRMYGYDAVIAGAGAIDMAARRMTEGFDLTPIYEIEGWSPTPFLGLP